MSPIFVSSKNLDIARYIFSLDSGVKSYPSTMLAALSTIFKVWEIVANIPPNLSTIPLKDWSSVWFTVSSTAVFITVSIFSLFSYNQLDICGAISGIMYLI